MTQELQNKPVIEPDDQVEQPSSRAPSRPVSRPASASAGFFTVYKPHQGTATRWGTAGGAALIVLYSALSIYDLLEGQSVYLQTHKGTLYLVIGLLLLALSGLTFWLMNRPKHVDFLISTDTEMKKVNWTSRRELIGSTKVIILFMFSIAAFLFICDILFGYLFYFIHVLKTRPL